MVSKDNFRRIDPYVPGDQPDFADMVKLNTNENPYPPAPAVIKAAEEFAAGQLKLYPPTDGGALRKELAAYHGVELENVFVGVGSDDVLSVIFQSCFNSGRKLLFPEISYSFYEVWAELYKVPYKKIPLRADFTINADDYISQPNGGIVIANPNAPTSMAMDAKDIERIVAANPDNVVVIDEAYIDFGGESVLRLTGRYENLIVVRTFSKSRSMAGLRIGYAIASRELIQALSDVKNSINSYTMNFPSIEVGKVSLAEEEYFKATLEKILKTREKLVEELSELGFSTLPSSSNFIFTTHRTLPAKQIFEELRSRHIFVRFFNKPLIDNYLRITVGTDEEVSKLIAALKEITQNAI